VLTGAVLATLPLLVLFVAAGKQLISGIMTGGEGLMPTRCARQVRRSSMSTVRATLPT